MAARTVTAKRFPPSPGDTRATPRDPRDYQVAALATLLVLGSWRSASTLSWLQVGVTLAAALGWQWLATKFEWSPAPGAQRAPFEYKSALISGLSLCLLLRTRVVIWAASPACSRWAASSCCACRAPAAAARNTS
jgi:hypothetical protein